MKFIKTPEGRGMIRASSGPLLTDDDAQIPTNAAKLIR